MARVRFAPSPTGNLHIGTVRTALFNWLYTRSQKGVFVLRIEDTDLKRSHPEYEENILQGMKWLGLDFDEGPGKEGDFGPYRQSERMEAGCYKKHIDRLMSAGDAYPCFCTDTDIDQEREVAQKESRPYVYSKKCASLTAEEVTKNHESGVKSTIRFKMQKDEKLRFTDLIRGDITFDLALISDFVIMKSDGSPTYNFAVVADDIDMEISHVIRGEDHISNTPRQIALFKALNARPPKFAHMPMILGEDRSKLSKRHGATGITEYRDQGFLPDAFFNFLTLLGWSPKDGKEILSKSDLVSRFSLKQLSKSNAVFDLTKVKWMNGQYIRKLEKSALFKVVAPFISDEKKSRLSAYSQDQIENIVFSVRDNLDVLSDIDQHLDVYLYDDETFKAQISTFSFESTDLTALQLFRESVSGEQEALSSASLNGIFSIVQEKSGLGKGKIFKPIRFAASGSKVGPDLKTFLEIIGSSRLIDRLDYVISKFS
jgi:nondiscriminating glutamyl-tRNA synthetase